MKLVKDSGTVKTVVSSVPLSLLSHCFSLSVIRVLQSACFGCYNILVVGNKVESQGKSLCIF